MPGPIITFGPASLDARAGRTVLDARADPSLSAGFFGWQGRGGQFQLGVQAAEERVVAWAVGDLPATGPAHQFDVGMEAPALVGDRLVHLRPKPDGLVL